METNAGRKHFLVRVNAVRKKLSRASSNAKELGQINEFIYALSCNEKKKSKEENLHTEVF